MANRSAPVRPGGIPMKEALQSRRINQSRSAKNISVHPRRLNQIIHALNLQARHELGGREGKAPTTA